MSAAPPAKQPRVIVCAGGGGVGKTTTSAALGLALARHGLRTLVVTIDPARRLADAMGVPIGSEAHPVHIDSSTADRLHALMPEPRRATRTFIEYLFEGEPEALARLVENRVYKALADALAGVHELVCMTLVARAARAQSFDVVVVDTAPSRYALDFVSYPPRLAALLEGRAMGFFGTLADRAREDEGMAANLARRGAEKALSRVLGGSFVVDMTNLFAELMRVRERFAGLAHQSADLLLGETARYVLVTAPTGAALADLKFLARKLDKLGRKPAAAILNRSDVAPRAWAAELLADAYVTGPMKVALEQIEAERLARTRAADQTEESLARTHPGLPRVRLPHVEGKGPADIVRTLAGELTAALRVVAGVE